MCDGRFKELPSGIGTKLQWGLRYVHGAPALHSKSTVSQLVATSYVQGIGNLIVPDFLDRYHTGKNSDPLPPGFSGVC